MKSITVFNTKLILLAGTVSLLLTVGFTQSVHAFTPTEDFFDAQADQGDNYQKRISELQEQVAKLFKQLNGSDVDDEDDDSTGAPNSLWGLGSGSSWVDFKHSLYRGSRDSGSDGDVRRLQRCLAEMGDYTYGEYTGYYGSATEEAVKSFQRRNNIVSSGNGWSTGYGWFGPKTQRKLNEFCKETEDPADDDTDEVENDAFEVSVDSRSVIAGDTVELSWSPTDYIEDDYGMYWVLRHAVGDSAIQSGRFSGPEDGELEVEIPTATDYCNNFFSDALGQCGEYYKNSLARITTGTVVNRNDRFYFEVAIFTPKETCFGFCGPNSITPNLGSDGVYKLIYSGKTSTFVIVGKSTEEECGVEYPCIAGDTPTPSYSQASYEDPAPSGGATYDDGNWTQDEMDNAEPTPVGVEEEVNRCEKKYWWSYYQCKKESGSDGDYNSWRDEYNNKKNTSSDRPAGSGWRGYVQGASTTNVIEQLKEIVTGLENLSLLINSR